MSQEGSAVYFLSQTSVLFVLGSPVQYVSHCCTAAQNYQSKEQHKPGFHSYSYSYHFNDCTHSGKSIVQEEEKEEDEKEKKEKAVS